MTAKMGITDEVPMKSKFADKMRETATQLRPRVRDFFVHIIGQVRVLAKLYPGIMHFLILWGMTVQIIGTIIMLMQIPLFVPLVELPFPRGAGYLLFELAMDMAGLAIVIGVGMAAVRRLVLRPKSLESRWDDYLSLALLFLIATVGFILEATRIIAVTPTWAKWSPIGYGLAELFRATGMSVDLAAQLNPIFYWSHIVFGLGFGASIPFTKLRHLVTAPLNILFRPLEKPNALSPIENIEEAEILGVGQVSEFTPQQLLSFDACLRCGRCEDVCPASISGMPLSPRALIQEFRSAMVNELIQPNGKGSEATLEEYSPEETHWMCTTCGACITACPVFVNPVSEIIDRRRYEVLTTGNIPKSVADVLRNMERQGNPWGMPPEDRTTWADGLEVRELAPGDETDILLFMGCAAAFDSRNRTVSQKFIKLLQKANVDFATLGLDEACCGETARRLGHEYLFQVLAEQNIELLAEFKFNRIVTQCPHCFNTLKNEYPQFGGNYEVQHYTEFLSEMTKDNPENGKSSNGKNQSKRLTFHDSCYLGRYNQIYDAPRNLLERANIESMELPQHLDQGFCCGGGGGQMWMETDPNTRINQRRLSEALEINADIVTTACPYCLIMFDDAIRSKGLGDQIQVKDIIEVIDEESFS